jgi:hypothetical protein
MRSPSPRPSHSTDRCVDAMASPNLRAVGRRVRSMAARLIARISHANRLNRALKKQKNQSGSIDLQVDAGKGQMPGRV